MSRGPHRPTEGGSHACLDVRREEQILSLGHVKALASRIGQRMDCQVSWWGVWARTRNLRIKSLTGAEPLGSWVFAPQVSPARVSR